MRRQRRWLPPLAWLILGLAASLLVPYSLSPQKASAPPYEIRDTRVLLMAGGRNEQDNYAAFYLSLVRLYETFTTDLEIPPEDITVLYYDGQVPDPEEMLNNEFGELDRSPETPNPSWYYRHHLLLRAAAGTRAALTSLPAPPPLQGDASRASIMDAAARLVSGAPAGSDLWIVYSGHGGVRVEENGVASTIETFGEEQIAAEELGEVLKGPTLAARQVLWLNLCMAFGFLDLPQSNPRLAVLTSCGARGADVGLVLTEVGPEWTWTQALREGLTRDSLSCDSFPRADTNRDRALNLDEIQQYILHHDAAAVKGVRPAWDADPWFTFPGMAFGRGIDLAEPIVWDRACLPAAW